MIVAYHVAQGFPSIALLLVVCCAPLVWGETYYVHPSGLDVRSCGTASLSGGCTGAAGCARQTLNGGVSCLSGGDTLIIKAGTYTNQCLGDADTPDTVAIPAGLSAAQPTTIRNAPGETVLIRSTSACNPGLNSQGPISLGNNRPYITFEGINVTAQGTIQILTLGPTSHATFKNMILSHGREAIQGEIDEGIFEDVTTQYSGFTESFAHVCPVPELGCHGVYLNRGNNNRFTRLIARGNAGIGIVMSCDSADVEVCPAQPSNNIVEQAQIYDNHGYGVITKPNNLVRNSLLYNNFVGVSGSSTVVNNTIIGNTNTELFGGSRANMGLNIGGISGQLIRNNIVLGHPDGDITTTGGTPGSATYSHNICGAVDSSYGCASTATQAALFVDPATRNYHLKSGAAAINAGTTLATVPDDMEGQARTAGPYDIGADEFFSGSAPPVLTITAPASSPTYSTPTSPLTSVAGTASDDGGVTSVTWTCDVCGSGTATCASCGAAATSVSWSIASITLQPGANVLTVRAQDAEGQIGSDTLTITKTTGSVHNVSTAAQLTTAMSAAVAGDEIILANGNYSGTFTTNNAGTSGQRITLRAANRHQAVLVGDNVCDRSHEGLVLADDRWVVQDLKFTQHGRAITITANNVEVMDNIIEGYREEGLRIAGGDNNPIHHNVIGYSKGCPGTDSPAVFVVTNADGNSIEENIIIATGNDGYTCAGGGGCAGGGKLGYGVFVANDSDNTLIQGNLFLGNGGKGVLRLLSDGANSAGLTGTLVRDNMFFFGEGGSATDDCNDDGNSFINNLFYGNYFWNWYTKGNDTTGNKGHHTFSHNTAIATALTRGNVGFITAFGGPATCNQGAQNYHIANILQNNVFYSEGTLTGGFDDRTLLTTAGTVEATSLATKSHNLFWAPSATGTWVNQYSYVGTDIHAPGSPPVFTNLAAGNFSLQAGSPGKNAASDGTDMGMSYNSSLKSAWSANVMALTPQETTGLTGSTTTSFAVSTTRPSQVWFYIPNSPCARTNEQFTVEGSTTDLVRDITTLNATATGVWIQAGGPQRYITLGRHTATDGTLNVAWQTAGCVERVLIRPLPTATEAYQWIVAPAEPPGPPLTLTATPRHTGMFLGR